MKKGAGFVLLAGWMGVLTLFCPNCSRTDFDLIIKNGLIVDGTGGKPFSGDVGIRGDKIAAVGNLSGKTAPRVIDADGLTVTPGFIDVHTHTDVHLLVNPKAESKIRQGVTTEISGNCGYSPFPLFGVEGDKIRGHLKDKYQIEADWSDLNGFFRRLERSGMALNYATLVGAGTIRQVVMGEVDRPATDDEMVKMKEELVKALEQGALGLSTGLEYTPGSFFTTEELIDLCRTLAQYGGLYASHIRNEDVRLEEAVAEALKIGKEAGVPVQISHLKACQQRNWLKIDRVLATIERARGEGIDVYADRYPYVAYNTTLAALFPLWAREGGTDSFLERLKDQSQLPRIRKYVQDKIENLGSWDAVLISWVLSEENKKYQGRTVAQITSQTGSDPFEFVRQLLIAEKGEVSMCGFAMSEENTAKVLAFPYTMVGSDGVALAPYGPLGRGHPHPRNYGTFPRILGYYVREQKVMTLPEAVRKMTSLPAQKFGFKDRGQIAVGKVADLVIFDAGMVSDRATFTNPQQYPVGMDYVIVNGQVVVDQGKHTCRLPGKILRRGI